MKINRLQSWCCILLMGLLIQSCSESDLERIGFLKVITVGISDLGTNSVILVGSTEDLRAATITESGFVLSGTSSDDASLRVDNTANRIIKSGEDILKEEGVFLANATGLESGVTYFYRAFLKIEEEDAYAYGVIESFTTPQLDIVIESIERNSAGCPTTASVNLNIAISGIEISGIDFGISWRNDVHTAPTLTDNIIPIDQIDDQGKTTVQLPINNCDDLYTVRAFIKIPGNEVLFSSEREFSLQEGGLWLELGVIPQQFEKQVCVYGFGTGRKGYVIGTGKGTVNSILWAFDPISSNWQQRENPTFSFTCGNSRPAALDRNFIQPSEFIEENESWEFYDLWAFAFSFRTSGFIHEDAAYLLTGESFTRINLFNVNDQTVLQDFPGNLAARLINFITKEIGYVGLGYILSEVGTISEVFNDLWAYDFKSQSWKAAADIPETFVPNDISMSMNGRGYVLTGFDTNGTAYPGFWEYNPDTDSWKRLADFGRGDGNADIGFVVDGITYGGLGISKTGVDRQEFWKYVPELE